MADAGMLIVMRFHAELGVCRPQEQGRILQGKEKTKSLAWIKWGFSRDFSE